jgi:sensor c-di-GMP phosphodiesterase-like protein
MAYLQRLPLDAVKIDHSFVKLATDEGVDSVVIESIVRLAGAAHGLTLTG